MMNNFPWIQLFSFFTWKSYSPMIFMSLRKIISEAPHLQRKSFFTVNHIFYITELFHNLCILNYDESLTCHSSDLRQLALAVDRRSPLHAWLAIVNLIVWAPCPNTCYPYETCGMDNHISLLRYSQNKCHSVPVLNKLCHSVPILLNYYTCSSAHGLKYT